MALGSPENLDQPFLQVRKKERKCLLLISVFFNITSLAFVVTTYLVGRREGSFPSLSQVSENWWNRAAALADKSLGVYCSGHGRVHVDTIEQDVCECTSCFTGKDCSQKLVNCTANVDGGDPLFLEPFWEMNAEAGAVVVPPTYRMSYSASPVYTTWSKGSTPLLDKLIRQVHEFVGNAVTKDRFLVLGSGSIELVNAAVASLSPGGKTVSPSVVVSRAPYYSGYKQQTELFVSTQYFWAGDAVKAGGVFNEETSSFIEILTAPNNPDSSMLDPVFNTSSVMYDRAYYWPHFTPITKAADDEVMLFSLSKLTGHAGSRLGWAIVKNETIYEKMINYVQWNTLGVSHDAQLRGAALLRAVLNGYASGDKSGNDDSRRLFHFGSSLMSARWERLNKVLENIPGLSVQVREPQSCLFFKKVVYPAPAYAWVKCEDEYVNDCYQFLLKAGIQSRPGKSFGAGGKHTRLALITHSDNFEQLVDRLALMSIK